MTTGQELAAKLADSYGCQSSRRLVPVAIHDAIKLLNDDEALELVKLVFDAGPAEHYVVGDKERSLDSAREGRGKN